MKVTKIEEPVQVFGIWKVYADGTIRGGYRTPSGRESTITIYPEMIQKEDSLFTKYTDRVVMDWNDFIPAFFKACKLAGIKSIPNFKTDFE